jgi:AraC family transcriptional regulator
MENEPAPLEPGRFYGVTHHRRRSGGIILSEAIYRAHQRVPPHRHERSYFGYLISGGYREKLGQRSERMFRAPALVFHRHGEIEHGEISDRGARLLQVELPDAWLERIHEHGAIPDVPPDHHRGRMAALARMLYREFRAPDPASSMVIEGVTLELLGRLLRTRVMIGAGDQRAARATAHTPWIARAREVCRAHALSAASLTDVASEVGVPSLRLARAFRRVFGESPGEYMRRLRIRAACERLAAGELSLATLASELGFFDQSHFTRVFRNHVGMPPGAWQREHASHKRRRR